MLVFIAVPPAGFVYHPERFSFSFVTFGNVPMLAPIVTIFVELVGSPPAESKVRVYSLAVQSAYSVCPSVFFIMVSAVIILVLLLLVFQPLKIYPAFVGTGSVPYAV